MLNRKPSRIILLAITIGCIANISTRASADTLKFDFGPEKAPVTEGFRRVTPDTLWNAERGFGWTDKRLRRARSEEVGLRKNAVPYPDPAAHSYICVWGGSTFSVAVSNGRYRVHLLLSDGLFEKPYFYTGRQTASVQGVSVLDRQIGAETLRGLFWRVAYAQYHRDTDLYARYIDPLFLKRDVTVDVADGRLNVALEDAFLCAMVVFPHDERQGDAFLKQWQADRRSAFEKTHAFDKSRNGYFPDETPRAATPTEEERRRGCRVFVRPFMKRVVPHSLPTPAETASPLRIEAARGEYEPLVLGVEPFRMMRDIRVEISDSRSKDGATLPASAVEVRYQQYAPFRYPYGRWYSIDPQMLVKQGAMRLDFEPGVTRAFWLTLRAPSSQPAGEYSGQVRLQASGKTVWQAPLAVAIHPFSLEDPPGISQGMFYYFPRDFYRAEGGKETAWDMATRMLADIRAHGCNGVDVRGLTEFSREGRRGPITTVNLDATSRFIHLAREAGLDAPVILSDGAMGTGGVIRSPFLIPFDIGTPEFQAQLDLVVNAFVKRAHEEKWPGYPDVWFWVTDETRNYKPTEGEDKVIELLKAYRACNQSVKLLCTINGKNELRFIPHLDMLAPNRRLPIDPELFERLEKAEVTFGYYNLGGASLECMRFCRGYFMWRTGCRWFYRWHYDQYLRDPFNPFDGSRTDTAYGYILPDDIAPAPVWEATREGIDDYRYIHTLRRWMNKARDLPKAAAALARAQSVWDELEKKVVSDYQHYYKGIGQWEGWSSEEHVTTRRKIARAIADLVAAAN